MPIANCIVSKKCANNSLCLVDLWAEESQQSSEHMTITSVTASAQFGNQYAVMAVLFLPSLWSKTAMSSLQRGLARALARKYELSNDEVHVITTIVQSGHVVDGGQEAVW